MPGIIVGIDGSAHSRRALEWAINEAAVRQAPLTVLAVHQAVAGWAGGGAAFPGDAEQTGHVSKAAQEATDAALEKLPAGNRPSVTVQAVNGIPTVEILKAGADADLIVLGSRGAGGFTRLLLGSVSSQVVHHAHCPVVIIPAERDDD